MALGDRQWFKTPARGDGIGQQTTIQIRKRAWCVSWPDNTRGANPADLVKEGGVHVVGKKGQMEPKFGSGDVFLDGPCTGLCEFGGVVDCFCFGLWPPGANSSFHSICSAHRISSFARVVQSSRRVDSNPSVSRVLACLCLMVCCGLPVGLAAGHHVASILCGPRLSSILLKVSGAVKECKQICDSSFFSRITGAYFPRNA
jgi:hypothetical protein